MGKVKNNSFSVRKDKSEERFSKQLFLAKNISTNSIPTTPLFQFLSKKGGRFFSIKFLNTIKKLEVFLLLLPKNLIPFTLTILFIVFSFYNLQILSWFILGIGFLTIGLPHGALDHLVGKKIDNKMQLVIFIINYLFKSVVLAAVWYLSPDIALVIFIIYSAWHFGQADFNEWGIKEGVGSLIWGLTVLLSILLLHPIEVISILKQAHTYRVTTFISSIDHTNLLVIQFFLIFVGVSISFITKSKSLVITLAYILLTIFLPLLISFGIYFIAQHSLYGWRHLKIGLQQNSIALWSKAMPFTLGGASIILLFMIVFSADYLGMFFISLSCLSMPHVFSMHKFYVNFKKASVIA